MTTKYQQRKQNDLDTLRRAADLRRHFDAGIFPTGSGQHSHFERLCRMGWLRFVGWGRDIDNEVERDVMIYDITNAGLEAIGEKSQIMRTSSHPIGKAVTQ